MVHHIDLGGKERPVCFTNAMARHYEEYFNRSFVHDLNEFFKQIAPMASEKDPTKMIGLAGDVSVVLIGNLMFSALKCGYRKEGQKVDFDEYDVSDWVLSDNVALSKMSTWLIEANVMPEKDQGDAPKKKPLKSR